MIIITKDIVAELTRHLASRNYDRVFALTDENTYEKCFPLVSNALSLEGRNIIILQSGDVNKNIEQLSSVWNILSQNGASRDSALINIGGGMVTDLGGLASATFKRGISSVNIPTTLMASVDAAAGGKTGINFNGLKNEIGVFRQPDCVMIDCRFLATLDRSNILSGYAEMLKHGLISSKDYFCKLISYDFTKFSVETISDLVVDSVEIKQAFTERDPMERDIRKALNFGHTIGHALESLSLMQGRKPLLHGIAIAAGLLCELYLSDKLLYCPPIAMRLMRDFLRHNYPSVPLNRSDYETVYELMTHDKKNKGGRIRFTLLADVGDVRIDVEADRKIIFETLDFYREL